MPQTAMTGAQGDTAQVALGGKADAAVAENASEGRPAGRHIVHRLGAACHDRLRVRRASIFLGRRRPAWCPSATAVRGGCRLEAELPCGRDERKKCAENDKHELVLARFSLPERIVLKGKLNVRMRIGT